MGWGGSGPPFSFLPIWRFDCLWGSEQLKMKVKVAQLCPTLCNPIDIQSMVFPLEWVAFPFPGDAPNPGIEPTSPAFAGRFFTSLATWEAQWSAGPPFLVNNFIYNFVSLKSSFYKKYKNTCLRVRCFCLCICLFSDKFSKWTNSLCYPLCACVKLIQSGPTPCHPMDCSLPNSSVHEIL